MPEGPEVEGFRAFAQRHLVGRRIVRARALDAWMLKEPSPAAFARRASGRTVTRADRRGKLLLLSLDTGPGSLALVLHFGMSGRPVVEDGPVRRHDRVVLDLDDGTRFRYRNVRRLGSVRLVTRAGLGDLLWSLGPDPLEVDGRWFAEAVSVRRAPVKALLLDQSFLAGVGNLYADEALFASGIRPDRPASSLSTAEARKLYAALRRIMGRGIREQRAAMLAPMRLRMPRTRDEPCPRCGGPVTMLTVGGRSSYLCRRCQV